MFVGGGEGVPLPTPKQLSNYVRESALSILGYKSLDGLLKALHGRMNNASADLTNTTTVASNTGVDNGADTSLDDLADIDTGSGTAEAQSGDLISSALTLGDLVHLGGVLDGIGNGAAYELNDSGSSSHAETADAGGLGDAAIAHIAVSVSLGEAGEVEALDLLGGIVEPLTGQTGYANTKLGTIAAHGVNQGAVLDTLDGIHGALAGEREP